MDLRAASSFGPYYQTPNPLGTLWPSNQYSQPIQSPFIGISRLNSENRPIFSNLSQNNIPTTNYSNYPINNLELTQQFPQTNLITNQSNQVNFKILKTPDKLLYLFYKIYVLGRD